MKVKTVTLADAERLLKKPDKAAILTIATSHDRFRPGLESGWLSSRSHWQHGKTVESVNHFGRHETSRGDVLAIRSLDTRQIVTHVLIEQITMIDCDQVDDTLAADLGYASVREFQTVRPDLVGRRGWLMHIIRVSAVAKEPPATQ